MISLLSIFSSMNITVWTAETTIHLAFVTTELCLYDRWQCISLEIKKIEELLRRNLALGTSYWSAHQDCNIIVCTSRHWRRIHIAHGVIHKLRGQLRGKGVSHFIEVKVTTKGGSKILTNFDLVVYGWPHSEPLWLAGVTVGLFFLKNVRKMMKIYFEVSIQKYWKKSQWKDI